MHTILKLLLSVTILSVSLYGMSEFGISLWPLLFSALSIVLFLSLFFSKLNTAAAVISKIIGVLSLVAFALLLIASTIGGSFHMSDSNQIIAVGLAFMALFGCMFFLLKGAKNST
jgi:hypothetical protein